MQSCNSSWLRGTFKEKQVYSNFSRIFILQWTIEYVSYIYTTYIFFKPQNQLIRGLEAFVCFGYNLLLLNTYRNIVY